MALVNLPRYDSSKLTAWLMSSHRTPLIFRFDKAELIIDSPDSGFNCSTMSSFISRHLHQLMHRARSRSRDREAAPSNTATNSTSHHEVQFVISDDGLTYIAPPYMVGVPVAQYNPPDKAPSVTKTTSEPSCIFTNPVFAGFNPEPSITRFGEDFFMTTATCEYFPGLPIYHSDDLLNWELVGTP